MEQDRPVAGPEAPGAREMVEKPPFSRLSRTAGGLVETVRRRPFGTCAGTAILRPGGAADEASRNAVSAEERALRGPWSAPAPLRDGRLPHLSEPRQCLFRRPNGGVRQVPPPVPLRLSGAAGAAVG